jgi:hypothetical protein
MVPLCTRPTPIYFTLKIQVSSGGSLIPPHVCVCPKPGPEIPTQYVIVFIRSMLR